MCCIFINDNIHLPDSVSQFCSPCKIFQLKDQVGSFSIYGLCYMIVASRTKLTQKKKTFSFSCWTNGLQFYILFTVILSYQPGRIAQLVVRLT